MSFIMSDEQRALCNTVRKITSEFGFPYWAEKARTGGKTDELWTALGRAGFLGPNIPEEFGGAGVGISELALVCEEVAAAGCPLLMMVVSPAICGAIIAAHGSKTLKQRWLPGLATGEIKMAFAITEPDAGSNSHNIATTATRTSDQTDRLLSRQRTQRRSSHGSRRQDCAGCLFLDSRGCTAGHP
jgi:alkylation response protein AidB-like acyl-CoA dehydrogenase